MPKHATIEAQVGGTPSDVADRLRKATRFTLAPYQGSPFRFGGKPLKGTVSDRRFSVALNERDWWTLLQPVARARLVPTDGGTRVEGEVGIPPWLLWVLRLTVVSAIPLTVIGAFAAGAPLLTALLVTLVMAGVVGGVGWNMNNANQQVEPLRDAVLTQLAGTSPSVEAPAKEPTAAGSRAAPKVPSA